MRARRARKLIGTFILGTAALASCNTAAQSTADSTPDQTPEPSATARPAPAPTATPQPTVAPLSTRLSSATPVPVPTPIPTPTPLPPPPVMDDVGPTGRWPSEQGFPPYETPADIVTDGSVSGLRDAIAELDSVGGVVEHRGDIAGMSDDGLRRQGDTPIVVRPPLGQRADFALEGNVYLRGSGLLLAGWYHQSGSVYVFDAANSGLAWVESDGGGEFRVTARRNTSEVVAGLWYEGVYRAYQLDVGFDRSTVNALTGGSRAHLDAVGLWLAGHARPVGSSAHVDTMQIVLQDGGEAGMSIRNSVVWPSSNVAFQGSGTTGFTIRDTWFAEPQFGRALFPTGDPGEGLDGFGAITGKAQISGSTMLGNTHPNSTVNVSESSLLMPGDTYSDDGGNTEHAELWSVPVPPDAPTHEELDKVWHD